ncbi:lipase [Skermania sp. ID1734]|uniref:lipase family protein n=1 Tax=Skermania sp. ID1734 TaxID=2597516 RepID=UPI00117D91D2|nr:lipase family protein [Skermania sp. ID1734]TSD96652.1 lipase [Skermania sp. ID1734]
MPLPTSTRFSTLCTTLIVAVGVLAGCGHESPPGAQLLPVEQRGTIVSQQPVSDSDAYSAVPGSRATLVLYRSTSGIDGSGVQVSGTVFQPPGNPPPGGWPVVTLGHGTTGLTDNCAPSRHPDLLGAIGPVIAFLQRGYVVAVSDYQGLGTPGEHPYLEPNSAAYDLIDAVRAARNVIPGTSDRWAAFGISQGGQASWAAAGHAEDYGEGLRFVGSADLSPAADLSPVMAGSTTPNLTLAQKMLLPILITGLKVSHHDLDVSAYLQGKLAADTDDVISCDRHRQAAAALDLNGVKVTARSPEDLTRIQQILKDIALPQRRADGPMLVVVGANDSLILPQWTEAAVRKACDMGDVIDLEVRQGEGHGDPAAVPGAVNWVADRFAGKPAPDNCATS